MGIVAMALAGHQLWAPWAWYKEMAIAGTAKDTACEQQSRSRSGKLEAAQNGASAAQQLKKNGLQNGELNKILRSSGSSAMER